MIGVCTAHALVERGARVALIDRSRIGSGCSYGNAGWISPSRRPLTSPGVIAHALTWLLDPESPFYVRPRLDIDLWRWLWRFRACCTTAHMRETFQLNHALTSRSAERYRALADSLAFGHSQAGLLVACRTPDALRGLETERQWFHEIGGASERLDPTELRQRVPELAPDLAGGVFFPGDAHIAPASFVRTLAEAARAGGAEVHESCELLALECSGATHARVDRAITTHGRFTFDTIVVAAGAYTPAIVRPLGARVPIEAAKGYSVTGPTPSAGLETPVLLHEAKVAVTPFASELRFAGTLELAGLDPSVNLRRVAALERAVRSYLPGLALPERTETWRGLRPLTPDERPILGPLRPFTNLVLATGHGMSGISQGPATGELVAQLISGESPVLDLAPFDPNRF